MYIDRNVNSTQFKHNYPKCLRSIAEICIFPFKKREVAIDVTWEAKLIPGPDSRQHHPWRASLPTNHILHSAPIFVIQQVPLWWPGSFTHKLSSQEQFLSSESGQYFEKTKLFLLSKPVRLSIQGLIFRFIDYLKPFAPFSSLLAISLLISIATEGWTGNIQRKNQSSFAIY